MSRPRAAGALWPSGAWSMGTLTALSLWALGTVVQALEHGQEAERRQCFWGVGTCSRRIPGRQKPGPEPPAQLWVKRKRRAWGRQVFGSGQNRVNWKQTRVCLEPGGGLAEDGDVNQGMENSWELEHNQGTGLKSHSRDKGIPRSPSVPHYPPNSTSGCLPRAGAAWWPEGNSCWG